MAFPDDVPTRMMKNLSYPRSVGHVNDAKNIYIYKLCVKKKHLPGDSSRDVFGPSWR